MSFNSIENPNSKLHSEEQNFIRKEKRRKSLKSYFQIIQDPKLSHFTSIAPPNLLNLTVTPTTTTSLKPAFLAHFPRSLSSLSIGGRKKPEKDVSGLTSPEATSDKTRSSSKQPPPLPQRNLARRSQPSPQTNDSIDGDSSGLEASPISSGGAKKKGKNEQENQSNANINNNYYNEKASKSTTSSKTASPLSTPASVATNKVKKRSKTKIKANSDPKISAQLFIQSERDSEMDTSNRKDLIVATGHSVASEPPPLPPRQPGMLEENQNLLNNNKCATTMPTTATNAIGGGTSGGRIESRPSPNSLETRMLYPLIATATAVRDNITQFPLSNRPNIRQRLQHQQNTHSHVSNLAQP